MFNMTTIGREISKRRKELNMTQVELADKLLVSYQAVSQWENGKSMPELSNLTRLAEVLDMPLEKLLGQKEAEVVEKVIDEEPLEDEDLIDVAPFIKPDKLKSQVEDRDFDIKTLTALAPFLESKTIKKYATSGSTTNLIALAPFLETDHLNELLEQMDPETTSPHQLIALAPFASSKALMQLLTKSGKPIKASSLIPLAPFLKTKHLDQLVEEGLIDGLETGAIVALAPFLSQKSLKKRIKATAKPNKPEAPQDEAEHDDVEFEPDDEVSETKITFNVGDGDSLDTILKQLKTLFKSGK